MTFWHKTKKIVKKFFLIDDTPHKVSAGAALGVFWGIMPGEGVATTLITSTILRFNRFSATAGVLASNMWGTVVVLPLAAIVGGKIFKVNPATLIDNFRSTYRLGIAHFFTETIFSELLLPLIIGFLVVSLAISLAIYLLLFALLKYRRIRFK